MADFYCDHGAYTSVLGTTPTWGVPQEGDGATKDAATASSIASIAFATVPTSGLMSVCGINIGTTGVIGAATVDAAADALAGLINAVTTAVAVGVAVGVPQLLNLVYARGPGGGAPAGTCQIMMRVGSATLNQATNSSAAIASTFDGTPTLVQFVGGTGGCWGWLINSNAIGVSGSIAALNYGIAINPPMVRTATLITDTPVWVRTGTNPTITVGGNVARATAAFALNLRFDTNTKWTGDAATGVFTIRYSGASDFYFLLAGAANSYATWHCLRAGNCVIAFSTTAANKVFNVGASSLSYTTCYGSLVGLKFVIEQGSGARFFYTHGGSSNTVFRAYGCVFDATAVVSASLPNYFVSCTSYDERTNASFLGCDFKWSLNGSPPDSMPICYAISNGSSFVVVFQDCSFSSGTSTKLKLITDTSSPPGGINFQAVRCSGINTASNFMGFVGVGVGYPGRLGLQSASITREFRLESKAGTARWDPAASPAYPTLAATLPNGTAWAMAAEWSSVAGIINPGSEYQMPAFVQVSRVSTGTKTITLEFFCPTNISNADLCGAMYVVLTYLSDGDVQRSQYLSYGCVDSAAAWAGAGSYPTYSARKLVIATDGNVVQYGDVSVTVGLSVACPNGTTTLVFFDPEVVIA